MTGMEIRPARNEDSPFLGWVIYTAARSHLAECPLSVIFGESEAGTRKLLERISQSSAPHWGHVSRFCIAEMDGKPAAAMCGFVPETEGTLAVVEAALDIMMRELDYPQERLAGIVERLVIATSGMADDLPDVWGIECVAVLPEFRGKGLIDRLFEHLLEKGREKGFTRAQILCLIGNEPGQRAWERNGFEVLTQKTSPEFDDLMGTPGTMLLAQDL